MMGDYLIIFFVFWFNCLFTKSLDPVSSQYYTIVILKFGKMVFNFFFFVTSVTLWVLRYVVMSHLVGHCKLDLRSYRDGTWTHDKKLIYRFIHRVHHSTCWVDTNSVPLVKGRPTEIFTLLPSLVLDECLRYDCRFLPGQQISFFDKNFKLC